MNDNLAGRRALVTGASRGIGRACAELLAARGARVAVHYATDRFTAKMVCEGLAGDGHLVLGADLGDSFAAADLPERAAEAFGGLDIVVNNAGIFEHHDLHDEGWAETWARTIAVNLDGPALIIGAALPHLERAGGGHIVNISSRGAYRGEPDAPAYGAAKAGLNALTQSLARKLAPSNIVVVGVAPGWVLTDMTREHLEGPGGAEICDQSPMGRVATAAEIAEVVGLAVSGRADALAGAILDANCASHFR